MAIFACIESIFIICHFCVQKHIWMHYEKKNRSSSQSAMLVLISVFCEICGALKAPVWGRDGRRDYSSIPHAHVSLAISIVSTAKLATPQALQRYFKYL